MHRKGLVIGIIILMLGVNIGSTFAGDVEVKTMSSVGFDGNTLYVGGSGPNNYTTIQSAINNAVDGDTVFVYNGTYTKDDPYDQLVVRVTKSINLIGEDKNTTIIKGSRKYGVLIPSANNVLISGFTLQDSGGGTYPGSCIFIEKKSNIIIDNNIFTKNPNCGIYCVKLTNCTFSNNIFIDNECAFYTTGSTNCSVTSNYFINNNDAINIYYQPEFYIYGNEFRNNGEAISLRNGIGVKISSNNFIDNDRHARYQRTAGLPYFFELLNCKQEWNSNYWDNWQKATWKPILGKIVIMIPTFIPLLIIQIPILSFEFDKTPAQEPYDIGV